MCITQLYNSKNIQIYFETNKLFLTHRTTMTIAFFDDLYDLTMTNSNYIFVSLCIESKCCIIVFNFNCIYIFFFNAFFFACLQRKNYHYFLVGHRRLVPIIRRLISDKIIIENLGTIVFFPRNFTCSHNYFFFDHFCQDQVR